MFTLDTNILIYAVDRTAGEKHLLALQLVDVLAQRNGSLPLQCLNEFYRACTQKRIIPAADAEAYIDLIVQSLEIVAPTLKDLQLAMWAHQQHQLAFWDALHWATARHMGCATIFTEDMQDGRVLDGLTFRNPFRLQRSELSALLR